VFSLAARVSDGRTFDDLISDVDVSDASWLEVNDLTYPLNQLSFVWMKKRLFCVMKAVDEANWERKWKGVNW
jgi:hypothetical protein